MTTTMRRSMARPLLFSLALLALLLPYLAFRVNGTQVNTRPEHSVAKHGELEVGQVHQKLSCDGPLATFKSQSWRRPRTRYFVCETEPGQFGMMIADRLRNGKYLEITTYMLGTAARAKEYLTARSQLIEGIAPWDLYR